MLNCRQKFQVEIKLSYPLPLLNTHFIFQTPITEHSWLQSACQHLSSVALPRSLLQLLLTGGFVITNSVKPNTVKVSSDEPKRGSPEAKKAYGPVCVANPTAKISVVLGFTVDLIHRDSILSPLHNSTKTHWELLNDALRRSTTRASHFEVLASRAMVQSPVIPAKGEYLMNISLGSPPITMLGIADTGSDLTWTQCKPCVQCYKAETWRLELVTLIVICSYYYSYGDQSYTNGVLASETVTFGSHTPSFPEVLVGCGHENGGTFNELGSGIIGLGGGAFSLDIEAELRKNIKAESVEDPEGVMSLCYKSDEDMDVPVVKVRFAGAELELKPSNTFVRVQEDMVCFAMIPASEVAIFGNLAQMDFLVGFDLEEGKVSLKQLIALITFNYKSLVLVGCGFCGLYMMFSTYFLDV
uniref:Peptidase A1 domain-containing protein n=1 Tax=Chenopodium quinoa TaxID=63459 RepID=A0A803NBP1_CHEQI